MNMNNHIGCYELLAINIICYIYLSNNVDEYHLLHLSFKAMLKKSVIYIF